LTPADRQAALAIDIGGTSIKFGIVAARAPAAVALRGSAETPAGGDAVAILEAIAREGGRLIAAAAAAGLEVAGTGLSVAGFVDADRTRMIYNENIGGLSGIPLRDEMVRLFARPAVLECDSNAAAWGEFRHGAGRGFDRMVMLTLGTGVGGGVVCDGRLLRYTGGCAGDMGHVIVVPGGRRCSCGARGCLEALAGSAGIAERAGGRPVRETIAAALAGDAQAAGVIAETGRLVGLALATHAHLFAPRVIVIGGGVSAAGALLRDAIAASFRRETAPFFADGVALRLSATGADAGMIGVADALRTAIG
jgi:glucokinase